MTEGQRLAKAAAELIGTPFRLQGRDPRFGLDCVGLVAVSLARIGRNPQPPSGYRLRNTSIDRWIDGAEASSLYRTTGRISPGDVVLVEPGPAQAHLLIAENENAFIHAHAGLRRVSRLIGTLPWAVERHWRLRNEIEEL